MMFRIARLKMFLSIKKICLLQMSTLLRDKLDMKKELVMSAVERRGEGER